MFSKEKKQQLHPEQVGKGRKHAEEEVEEQPIPAWPALGCICGLLSGSLLEVLDGGVVLPHLAQKRVAGEPAQPAQLVSLGLPTLRTEPLRRARSELCQRKNSLSCSESFTARRDLSTLF